MNQKDGIPTDTQRHSKVWWFPLDELPVILAGTTTVD